MLEPGYKAGQYTGGTAALRNIKSVDVVNFNHFNILSFHFICFISKIFFIFVLPHPRFNKELVLCRVEN